MLSQLKHKFRTASPWSPNMGPEPVCGVCWKLEDDPMHEEKL